jgi:nucleoside 2-deoxyribosyltransferase
VIGYADDLRPLRERLQALASAADGRCRDSAGWTVEDFGLTLNLMLGVPVQIEAGGLEAGLQAVRRRQEACT